jgi:tetratricopeptide (TPR) repeat protein
MICYPSNYSSHHPSSFPDAGHLIHMPTHIDVLLGDYVSCIEYNKCAILADLKLMKISPDTFDTTSFYFGYSVHNFHMVVYGGIMGGFESVATDTAIELNQYLTEDLFDRNPDLALYLESYCALDIHVLIRFGRWEEILQIPFPRSSQMLYRHAILHFARGLALANTGQIELSMVEADLFDKSRLNPIADKRTLHNNIVSDVLAVDAPMLRGEIAYFSGRFEEAFSLLRQAIELQDGLNYDEPWGKMQPIRHSLGGLLCDQHQYEEAEQIFRQDLKLHPNNPWALVGLVISLNGISHSQDVTRETKDILLEVQELRTTLAEQRKSKWADSYDVAIPCACCTKALQD